jgi:hypothetical protein
VKQAGQSVGAGPLRWVVVERAGGLERARIRSGPRVGKERKGKEKWKVGRLSCASGFRPKKKVWEIRNLFIIESFSKLQNYLNFGRFYPQY